MSSPASATAGSAGVGGWAGGTSGKGRAARGSREAWDERCGREGRPAGRALRRGTWPGTRTGFPERGESQGGRVETGQGPGVIPGRGGRRVAGARLLQGLRRLRSSYPGAISGPASDRPS